MTGRKNARPACELSGGAPLRAAPYRPELSGNPLPRLAGGWHWLRLYNMPVHGFNHGLRADSRPPPSRWIGDQRQLLKTGSPASILIPIMARCQPASWRVFLPDAPLNPITGISSAGGLLFGCRRNIPGNSTPSVRFPFLYLWLLEIRYEPGTPGNSALSRDVL